MIDSQSSQSFELRPLGEDLRHYAQLVWKWSWLILLAVLLAAGSTYLFSSRMTPIYQASTTLLVDEGTSDGSSEYQSILMSERMTQTYAELLSKEPVLEAALERLSLTIPVKELRGMLTVEPVRDTQLIEIRIENESPELASLLANTLVEVFIFQNDQRQSQRYQESKLSLESQLARMDDVIAETIAALDALPDWENYDDERNHLELTLSQYQSTYSSLLQSYEEVRTQEAQTLSSLVQVEPAAVPDGPIRPRTLINTGLAGLVGAILAAGGIFLVDALDDAVTNPDQIETTFGLSVLGMVPQYPSKENTVVAVARPRHHAVEAIRALRTNLKYTRLDRDVRKILITSAEPGIGKTELATNLAVVFAQSGSKALLIDADLRRPRVHHSFGIENRQGLSRLIVRGPNQNDQVQNNVSDISLLSVLTTGPLPPNPAEMLGSRRMAEILNYFSQDYDFMIVDSPPVMAVTDAVVLSRLVDGVLLVAKPGETKLGALEQSINLLRQVNANILGIVLNDIPQNGSRYYYKGYLYYSYQGYYNKENS